MTGKPNERKRIQWEPLSRKMSVLAQQILTCKALEARGTQGKCVPSLLILLSKLLLSFCAHYEREDLGWSLLFLYCCSSAFSPWPCLSVGLLQDYLLASTFAIYNALIIDFSLDVFIQTLQLCRCHRCFSWNFYAWFDLISLTMFVQDLTFEWIKLKLTSAFEN